MKKVVLAFVLLIVVTGIISIFLYVNKQGDDEKVTIGLCIDNLVIERWQKDQEIFRSTAIAQGAEVIVMNANEDNDTQNRQIRQLIDEKVDVLVVIPYDKDGLAEAIAEASKAGIKIIAYDRLIQGAPVDAYISFDNVKVGETQAEALISKIPKGNYVIISGSPDDNNSYMFYEGYMNVLKPYMESGDIKVIGEIWADNWREEYAYDLVSELLDKGKQIDGIIAANDRLAEAAIRALSEVGMADQVLVAGHDADISACQRIVEGSQYMTVYKPIHVLARQAVTVAMQFEKGEEIAYDEVIFNGVLNVPYIKLDVYGVTAETMDETVIADGFHSKEAVYRNQD